MICILRTLALVCFLAYVHEYAEFYWDDTRKWLHRKVQTPVSTVSVTVLRDNNVSYIVPDVWPWCDI